MNCLEHLLLLPWWQLFIKLLVMTKFVPKIVFASKLKIDLKSEKLYTCTYVYLIYLISSAFRDKEPENLYIADVENIQLQNNDTEAIVNLTNQNGKPLILNITVTRYNTYRIIIEEADSERYHLQDVLDGEPRTYTLVDLT